MTGEQYLLLAFAATLILLLGYWMKLWAESRSIAQRERRASSTGGGGSEMTGKNQGVAS